MFWSWETTYCKREKGVNKERKAFLAAIGTCCPAQVDSDLIRTYLAKNGWKVSKKIAEADLIIINTCAFIKQKEDESLEAVRKIQEEEGSHAEIIVAGCLPAINKAKLRDVFKGITIGANSMREFDKVLNAQVKIKDIKYLDQPRFLVKNGAREYGLRIGWGCSGKCSYCAVRFVFGKPRSRPLAEILREFGEAFNNGHRDFLLVANDAGSYGEDHKFSLVGLLAGLSREKRGCRFALSHLNPDKLKESMVFIKKLVRSGKVFRINIPVESGSDRIIRLMNRHYTVDDFKSCVEELRDCNPGFEIMTDIMVGFPSETEGDFSDTLRLVEWLGRKTVHFQALIYSSRPNTEACKLPGQIDQRTKEIRFQRLKNLCDLSRMLRHERLFKKMKRRRAA